MATAKSLQIPKIIGILKSTIRVAHPDISRYPKTRLAAPIAAAATAMSVYDNNGFADNDWFIVGVIGDSQTEEDDVNGAVTRGQNLTVTNTLKFGHEFDAPVNLIYERQIKIYGAATDGGAGTLIATVSIQWNRQFTEYTLKTTDTAYAYYYAVFTDGTTDSSAGDYVIAAGISASSAEYIMESAISKTDAAIGNKITRERLVRWVNEAQLAVTQFSYQDPLSGLLKAKDWTFEIFEDISSIAITQNENQYAISGLSSALKHDNSPRGIISVRIGDREPMEYVDPVRIQKELSNKPRTQLNGAATAADTSITVDSTAEFADSGSLFLGALQITYTGKTSTTFTGIPASGTGSIAANQADNTVIWQSITPTEPKKYTIIGSNIVLNAPPSSDYVGMILKVTGFKKLTAITEESDQTAIPFPNILQLYVASEIESRQGNDQRAQNFMNQFMEKVLANAIADTPPLINSQDYYQFVDP